MMRTDVSMNIVHDPKREGYLKNTIKVLDERWAMEDEIDVRKADDCGDDGNGEDTREADAAGERHADSPEEDGGGEYEERITEDVDCCESGMSVYD